ncbi:putative repeat protein (TIGR03943 family) [Nonomuraea polychroma]|uniref:Putative repeat protein (TIGR03943 family) n=1 Tax=Nonomuraea polychroma TaxID=46176 RepID=A0A438M6H9_9ACTN|nr:TIGR03943 family protein [Nonomuraea polychroma]RVX41307.1 putative repeat protein (TIGR03943 family) [Nonomuraea polychroma]
MSRTSQALLLLQLGAALLWISAFSADFTNYVKPGFQPLLITAGAVLTVLGAAVPALERRRRRQAAITPAALEEELHLARLLGREPVVPTPTAAHEEHHDPVRIAWLLAAPAAAIFLVAPPALGSYTVQQAEHAPAPPPPSVVDAALRPLKHGRVNDLTMSEFAGRAWSAPASLKGKRVRLTGFAVPSPGGWHLARLRIGCCAADAQTMKVTVKGRPPPRPTPGYASPAPGSPPRGRSYRRWLSLK